MSILVSATAVAVFMVAIGLGAELLRRAGTHAAEVRATVFLWVAWGLLAWSVFFLLVAVGL